MNKILTTILQAPPQRKSKLPVSLRTARDEKYYAAAKRKGKSSKPLLEEERLAEWQHWALIENEFPYSSAFKVHHLLIPKRVACKTELKKHELAELDAILDELSEKYDCHLVNYVNKQSIRSHYHVHMLVYKDTRKELKI